MMKYQNLCHQQLLRIGDKNKKRALEENAIPSTYDMLVQRLRISNGTAADPFFPWVCCMCEKELCVVKGLRPSSCFQKYGIDGSHRVCNTCWFVGKNGTLPFASEEGVHACVGCLKGWPRADRMWKRTTNKGLSRTTKQGDVTEAAYA